MLSIIGKEEQGGDQDMMCLLQLTVTARDSIYCPVEGRGRGGSKLCCPNCYASMTRKVTSSRSKRGRRKRRREGAGKRIRRREEAGDGDGKGAGKEECERVGAREGEEAAKGEGAVEG